MIRSLAEGHRRSALSPSLARFSDARRSGTGFGQGSPAARQRSTLDGVEHCGFRRRPWQHGGQPRVLSDPSRGERVETPGPSVLVMVVLRSGSVRSPRRREVGLSIVCHRHLPRWMAKVDGLRSGDGRRLQRESPCGVSSGAEGRVARRLWPISCGQRGSCPDVHGLVSREPLLQVVDAFADLGLWGSMPRGARISERLRLSSPDFGSGCGFVRDGTPPTQTGRVSADAVATSLMHPLRFATLFSAVHVDSPGRI